jgi:hypothetical protein
MKKLLLTVAVLVMLAAQRMRAIKSPPRSMEHGAQSKTQTTFGAALAVMGSASMLLVIPIALEIVGLLSPNK